MKRKSLLMSIAIVLFLVFSQPVFGAEKPNSRKGKYLFRKYCRTCHVENGKAMELSPISKTQAKWTAVFKNGGFEKLSCKGEWTKRSEQDLVDIYAYMHDHAYDSPSPLKCK